MSSEDLEPTEINEEVVEQLKLSKEAVGAKDPIVLDVHGKIVDGHHRDKVAGWPSMKDESIKTPLDRLDFMVLRNWVRTEKSEGWKRKIVEAYAKLGQTVNDVVQRTGIPKSTVYLYYPQERKDQVKVEAGKVSGEARSVPTLEHTVKTQDKPQFVQCSCCPMGTYSPKDWQGKPVCPSCHDKLSKGEITLKEPKASVEKSSVEVHEYKPKETGEHRKAVMSPGVSKMDEAVFLALQQNEALRSAGWKFEFQKSYCIKRVRSDVTASRGDAEKPLFFDGEVHIGREDRDEANRGLLARRLKIPEVHAFSYEGAYSDAKRDEIVAKIVEKLT